MQIASNCVVHIHYTLKSDTGDVLDSSTGEAPLGYVHGNGNIIPGLETALTGRTPGDRFSVAVPPEQAYGERDEALVQAVPRSAFEGIGELRTGMQLQAQTDEGARIFTVASIGEDSVTVDANHPLAGQTLNFEIEVDAVREATAEEVAEGQVHDQG